jgi:hypothetical protein
MRSLPSWKTDQGQGDQTPATAAPTPVATLRREANGDPAGDGLGDPMAGG